MARTYRQRERPVKHPAKRYIARCANAGASGQKMRAILLTCAGSPVVRSTGGGGAAAGSPA